MRHIIARLYYTTQTRHMKYETLFIVERSRQCKQSATIAYVTGWTYAVLTNQSAAMAYVTGYTYAVLTNQSAAMAYVTGWTYAVLTNQSTAIVYVTGCTSRCVRHGVYVRFLTNQSTGIAYVTGCTYAFRFDQSEHDILMRVRPLNMCAPPSRPPCAPLAPPCAPLKIRLDRPLYYYS